MCVWIGFHSLLERGVAMKRKERAEFVSALVETLRTMRAEMIGLRAVISGEIFDLRSVVQGLAAQGYALERVLADEEVIDEGVMDELPALCICEADQRIAGWRQRTVDVE